MEERKMALRSLDNALPTTPERPKKVAKVTPSPIRNRADSGVNDENAAPTTVVDPTPDYIASKDLKPLPDPEAKIQGLLDGLDSKDWVKVCEALNDARRLALYHSSLLLPIMDKVMLVMVKAMKNPRSSLCKTSIMASTDIFQAFGHLLLSSSPDAFDHLASGITPDDITFVAVLLACTHGGLVDHGWRFFESMEKEFSISPKLEHYGCMVDLLGRAGQLDEAYALITSMPMRPDSVVWGALLGACSFYGHVELAERAAEFLFELEPWNPGNYVILSNVYAASDRWDGVAKVRMQMKGSQMKKAAGYSFIESGGIVHKFIVEDRSHPRADEIYALLDEVMANMKLLRYFHNLDSELENYE